MDLKNYPQKFASPQRPKIYTREMELADQIFQHFYHSIPFPRLMNMIKTKGYQAVYETFNEVRQAKSLNNPVALFLWKVGKIKIIWK